MNIEIWSVGKENEAFIGDGLKYYFPKISHYNSIELVLLQPNKKNITTDANRAKIQEEELILKRLQPHHYLVLLDERGTQLSSIQWADHVQQCMTRSVKTLVFLIGGAYGVTDVIRNRADQCRALSAMIFPHQLVRLIVAEQVYRALSIIHHSQYHHG